ncbi:MAG: nucleoside triphosphate pyrophosphohydrolase [Oscillospiraceae bacterium]
MICEFNFKNEYTCDDLLKIMDILRSENGCPWDISQTHTSIKSNVIEEAYEVLDAIEMENDDMLKEELGDLLLQVVFHSQIAKEEKSFNFDDVADGICKKLIERHPHIFSNVVVNSTNEVLDNWDTIKQKQKGQKTCLETLESVPKVFPALMRSQKVQKRAAKSGFDYPVLQMAFDDLQSEIVELQQAISNNDVENIFEELGDVAFSVVNVSRFLGVDCEDATQKSCDKFIDRFSMVEKLAISNGIDMKNVSIDVLNDLWKQAKLLKENKKI